MKLRAPHLRWLFYAAAALLLAAGLLSQAPVPSADVVLPAPRRPAPAETAATSANGTTSAAGIALQPRAAAPVLVDPFAGAAPTQQAARPPPLVLARPVAAQAPPEPAPPLPFGFLGRWTEQGRTTVFLQRGDKTVAVTGPGRIDDRYHLRAIDEQGLLIEHLPSRSTQILRFEAPPPMAAAAVAGAARGAPPTPAPSATEDMGEN